MLQVIIGSVFLFAGVFCLVVSVLGLFRFDYVLNRMHAASIADTLGLGLSAIGLIVMTCDFSYFIRLSLAVIFLWMASPVCSHIIAKTEILTNERIKERIGRK